MSAPSVRVRLAPWFAATALAVLFVTGAANRWGRDCTPLVDTGTQIYTAWRVSAGDVLYRDVAYYNGPLTAYLYGGLFRLTGPSIDAVRWVNLGLIAAMTGLIVATGYRLGGVGQASSLPGQPGRLPHAGGTHFAGWGGGALFLIAFAFARYYDTNNYNWLLPYSHELTWGLALSLAALHLAWCRAWPVTSAAAAGLLCGAVLLTKAEVAAAGVGATVLALTCPAATRRSGAPRTAAVGAGFAGGLSVGPTLAVSLLAREMPFAEAVRGCAGTFLVGGRADVRALPFFAAVSGWDDPLRNAVRAVGAAVLVLGCARVAWVRSRSGSDSAPPPRRRGAAALAALALVAAAAVSAVAAIPAAFRFVLILTVAFGAPISFHLGAALPVLAAVIGGALLPRVRRAVRRGGGADGELAVRRFTFAALAGGLLLKVALNTTVAHYGFALALPATLLCWFAAVDWLPSASLPAAGRGRFAGCAAAAFAAWLTPLLVLQCDHDRAPVKGGSDAPDAFRIDRSRPEPVAEVAGWLRGHTPDDATVLVLPEGELVNYLARRRTPTRYLKALPPEMHHFGIETVTDAIRSNPPDAVVWVPRDTAEYGVTLGDGYLDDFVAWVRAEYRVAETFPYEVRGSGGVSETRAVEVLVPR